eukprot:4100726-Amphidinium_carterae.1
MARNRMARARKDHSINQARRVQRRTVDLGTRTDPLGHQSAGRRLKQQVNSKRQATVNSSTAAAVTTTTTAATAIKQCSSFMHQRPRACRH